MRFGFLVHPLHPKETARKYPWTVHLPDFVIEGFLRQLSPKLMGRTSVIQGAGGAETSGVFVGIPLTPAMFRKASQKWVEDTLVNAVEIAREEGCEVVGLGAFSAVWKDGGETLARRTGMAITTGNSYTVAAALEGAITSAQRVGIEPGSATLAVLGGGGSIGRACAIALAPQFRRTIVIGRDPERTRAAADAAGADPSFDAADVAQADVVVAVTSAEAPIIHPEMMRPGSVIVDVSRPRNVSPLLAEQRPDVLVIEGGVIEVPNRADFGLEFGFPPGTAYACMAETMLLALEGRAESYTLGKSVSPEQISETSAWAAKHGFRLAGCRAFERPVPEAAFERVRQSRMAPR